MLFRSLFCFVFLTCAGRAVSQAEALQTYRLRGYHDFTEESRQAGTVAVHRFVFPDADHAGIFASKIYSDYELTVGNRTVKMDTPRGPVDVITLGGAGYIAPLLAKAGLEVDVLVGGNLDAIKAEAARDATGTPARKGELTHPMYMDKWDRYCVGCWGALQDVIEDPDHRNTPESFYGWEGQVGINPQINGVTWGDDLSSNDNLLRWLRKYFKAAGVKYQNVEWLQAIPDLYNRNPFLSTFDSPGMMSQWSYYGEVPHAPGLLRDVQQSAALGSIRNFVKDPNLMAVLDPDGEIGPFDCYFWGEYGPVQQRNFVRYLREVRHFTLDDVSRRYCGTPGQYKDWSDVPLADWRTFYGWTSDSIDLAGQWRVMRDDQTQGLREGWEMPAYNDSDWIRLYYPGDMTLYSLPDRHGDRPIWMRRAITVDPAKFPDRIYLTVAPLCQHSAQVFVNGHRVGTLDPRFSTSLAFGQFDVTDLVRPSGKLLVALRFPGHFAPNGPVFLTPKPIQDFPTDDPLLNARRYDHMDFMDWATADIVGQMLRRIREVEPDRPIKVHAFANSPWGWKMVAALGGYSHHTGAGAGWSYTVPKQYALARNLQDSCETGGPMETPRDLKGLFGNLIFMGKNAHDYFINLQSITEMPGMRKWFVDHLPALRIMGRENVDASPIASIRGLRNTFYFGEFAKSVNWRHGYEFARGGEMTPLLDEIRVGEGHLPYRAIFDENTMCWDEQFAKGLRQYVEDGGNLFLQAGSGLHTMTVRDAYPGPALAGVRITGTATPQIWVTLTAPDDLLRGAGSKAMPSYPHTNNPPVTIEPLPGTEVLGVGPKGEPVITKRRLGKGAVYYCAGGLWPGEIRQAVTNKFGFPVYAKVDGKGVDEIRTAQTNNGCEDLLMLRGLGGKPATVHWTFDYAPAAIYNPVNGEKIPATITGSTAIFTVNIPDWEFAWYAARRPDAAAQFNHWVTRQSQIWSGYPAGEPTPKLPPFRTLDLNRGWKLAQTDSEAAAEKLLPLDDQRAGLRPADLGFWSAPGTGLKSGSGVFGLYRRDFTLPEAWDKNCTVQLAIDGQIWGWPHSGVEGPSAIYVNGHNIWSGDKIMHIYPDITAWLKPGRNRIEMINEGQGILASIYLLHSAKPESAMDLAGDWQAVDGLQSVRTVKLPGDVQTSFVYRDVMVPKEEAGKEVWLYVNTAQTNSAACVIVNGRNRYSSPRRDYRPLEVNVTPEIRFGGVNRFLIGSSVMSNGWFKSDHDYRKIELRFYTPGSWSADGRGIRDALTPKELAAVGRFEDRVQLYPLARNPITKTPLRLFSFSDADAKSWQPPSPLVDLELKNGAFADNGSAQLPVEIHGRCEPFHDHDGAVTGLRIFASDPNHGYVSLPEAPLQKMLSGKDWTMAAWVNSLTVAPQDEGMLVQWPWGINWTISSSAISFMTRQDHSQRVAADNVFTPREWHLVAVTMKDGQATLYLDGLNIASRQTAFRTSGGPFMIGSSGGHDSFLDMKLARFAIYPAALTDDEVGKLYVRDQDHFADHGNAYPEEASFRLAPEKPADVSEIPNQLIAGPGTKPATVDGGPTLNFDGKSSWLRVIEPHGVWLFHDPFSLVVDFKPAPGAEGTIFRRLWDLRLFLRRDGALSFESRSPGKQTQLLIPKAINPGQWNRIMLTYDGQTASVFRDGQLVTRQTYPGGLSDNADYPMCIGADAGFRAQKFLDPLAMDLREFTVYPRVLTSVPPPAHQ